VRVHPDRALGKPANKPRPRQAANYRLRRR
jgi:hypothetical protein